MTQSGQGDDPRHPQARQAREGIVLPADGSAPLMPGTAGVPAPAAPAAPGAAPAEGSPWGGPWGPDAGAPGTHGGAVPGQSWGGGQWNDAGYAGELPPEAPGQQPGVPPAPHAAPLPPAAEAPQLPPVPEPIPGPPGHYDYGMPQQQGAYQQDAYQQLPYQGDQGDQGYPSLPAPRQGGARHRAPAQPPGGHADEAATQYIPPVGGGALPPEMPAAADHGADATAYLGRVPGHAKHSAPPQQPAQPYAPQHSDSEATQYLAPVQGAGPDEQPTQYIAPVPTQPEGPRQPPPEFDSLFRTQAPGGGDGGSTQQLPRFQPPGPQGGPGPHPGYGAPGQDDGAGRDGGGRGRRGGGGGRSKGPLIAVAGVAIVVLGVGAGALFSSGGDDDGKDDSKTVSATAPASEDASPSPDPAKTQATALDELLGDSNSSRAAVIKAVGNVKSCTDLAQSAKDLRGAAKQRSGLVTRLSKLSVDRLPGHQALTDALNDAWKASASADNHYAAWADQVAGNKKNCPKGHARNTSQAGKANTASGDATKAKNTASKLWNTIAEKYGLTSRQPSQL
ncbi:hypothetical protein [Streptomyces sp. NPDC050560]|uniref:hypothetical protein n=1 Tax=Streptomyces sp. NPDC050560 TaxID=3365630 RepID=UPI0037A15943